MLFFYQVKRLIRSNQIIDDVIFSRFIKKKKKKKAL